MIEVCSRCPAVPVFVFARCFISNVASLHFSCCRGILALKVVYPNRGKETIPANKSSRTTGESGGIRLSSLWGGRGVGGDCCQVPQHCWARREYRGLIICDGICMNHIINIGKPKINVENYGRKLGNYRFMTIYNESSRHGREGARASATTLEVGGRERAGAPSLQPVHL